MILSAAIVARLGVRSYVGLSVMSIVLASAAPASAQTITDWRVWMTVVGQGQMAEGSPWRWSFDSLVRMRDGAGTLDFLSGRLVIHRDLTARSTVGAGYAYGAGFPDEGGTLNEHRFLQQYVWRVAAGVGSLSLRSRLEERLIEGDNGPLVRARQQVRVSRDVSSDGRLQFVVYDELLLYANTTSRGSRGLDSHRIFAGLRPAVTAQTAVEIGYLNLYVRSRSGPNRRSHVLSATLVAQF